MSTRIGFRVVLCVCMVAACPVSTGNSAKLAQSQAPASRLNESAVDTKLFTINTDEALWRFAERVTGNARNWQRIAKHNGLPDVQTLRLKSGQTLRVPTNLLLNASSSAEPETPPSSSEKNQMSLDSKPIDRAVQGSGPLPRIDKTSNGLRLTPQGTRTNTATQSDNKLTDLAPGSAPDTKTSETPESASQSTAEEPEIGAAESMARNKTSVATAGQTQQNASSAQDELQKQASVSEDERSQAELAREAQRTSDRAMPFSQNTRHTKQPYPF